MALTWKRIFLRWRPHLTILALDFGAVGPVSNFASYSIVVQDCAVFGYADRTSGDFPNPSFVCAVHMEKINITDIQREVELKASFF